MSRYETTRQEMLKNIDVLILTIVESKDVKTSKLQFTDDFRPASYVCTYLES